MTNYDILQQYVNTGISIPVYQYDKLDDNLKKSYIRKLGQKIKLKIRINDDDIVIYLSQSFDVEYVDDFVKLTSNRILKLDDKLYKMCVEKIKNININKIIKKITDGGCSMSNSKFDILSDEQKKLYINFFFGINKKTKNNKEYIDGYIQKKIIEKIYLYSSAFLYCDDNLKNIYILSIIKNDPINMNDVMFKYCDDNLKELYIDSIIYNDLSINNIKFFLLDGSLKQKYIKHYIDLITRRNRIMDVDIFNELSDNLKKSYLLKNADKHFCIEDNIFDVCSDELKEFYFRHRLNNNRTSKFSHDMWEWYKERWEMPH